MKNDWGKFQTSIEQACSWDEIKQKVGHNFIENTTFQVVLHVCNKNKPHCRKDLTFSYNAKIQDSDQPV